MNSRGSYCPRPQLAEVAHRYHYVTGERIDRQGHHAPVGIDQMHDGRVDPTLRIELRRDRAAAERADALDGDIADADVVGKVDAPSRGRKIGKESGLRC